MAKRHPPHNHRHGHEHSQGPDRHDHAPGGRLLGFTLVLTAGFMLLELIGGLLANSLALLADAGHMLTDSAALALAWIATRMATRPADARRSFGYQRLRVLATFVNGCALLAIVVWIGIEAVQRLLQPAPVNAYAILWIGSLGLLVNLVVFATLRRGDEHDLNVAAATLHVLSDLLGSCAAIVAALVILRTGWLPVDPLLSMLVCALIVRSAIALTRRSAHILLEGSPDWLDLTELRSVLEQHVPGIRDVHHVHCWLVGPQETLLTMHASVDREAGHATVLRNTQSVLREKFGITHATIQLEAEGCVEPDCGPGAEIR